MLIAGVDEAGRGPLAGPLFVAAVILEPGHSIEGLDDSKKLSERRRNRLFDEIRDKALAWSIIEITPARIDALNIFQATMAGMAEAVCALQQAPELALVDGNQLPRDLPCAGRAIVGGDGSEAVIGAASILAKVARDRCMLEWHAQFPEYGFDRHKGYPTADHLAVLRRLGPCPIHRRSFAPVRACSAPDLFA